MTILLWCRCAPGLGLALRIAQTQRQLLRQDQISLCSQSDDGL